MNRISDLLSLNSGHVCPRWLCFTFDNVFRKLIHNPYKILYPYIKKGNTVLDIGPGIGYFTIPMAKMVGDKGRVIAVDIQREMLSAIRKRAKRAGMLSRVSLQLASSDSLGVKVRTDFILAFWMVHEIPDKKRFFSQTYSILKKSGRFLLAEPKMHVSKKEFEQIINYARKTGFSMEKSTDIFLSRSVLFFKKEK